MFHELQTADGSQLSSDEVLQGGRNSRHARTPEDIRREKGIWIRRHQLFVAYEAVLVAGCLAAHDAHVCSLLHYSNNPRGYRGRIEMPSLCEDALQACNYFREEMLIKEEFITKGVIGRNVLERKLIMQLIDDKDGQSKIANVLLVVCPALVEFEENEQETRRRIVCYPAKYHKCGFASPTAQNMMTHAYTDSRSQDQQQAGGRQGKQDVLVRTVALVNRIEENCLGIKHCVNLLSVCASAAVHVQDQASVPFAATAASAAAEEDEEAYSLRQQQEEEEEDGYQRANASQEQESDYHYDTLSVPEDSQQVVEEENVLETEVQESASGSSSAAAVTRVATSSKNEDGAEAETEAFSNDKCSSAASQANEEAQSASEGESPRSSPVRKAKAPARRRPSKSTPMERPARQRAAPARARRSADGRHKVVRRTFDARADLYMRKDRVQRKFGFDLNNAIPGLGDKLAETLPPRDAGRWMLGTLSRMIVEMLGGFIADMDACAQTYRKLGDEVPQSFSEVVVTAVQPNIRGARLLERSKRFFTGDYA